MARRYIPEGTPVQTWYMATPWLLSAQVTPVQVVRTTGKSIVLAEREEPTGRLYEQPRHHHGFFDTYAAARDFCIRHTDMELDAARAEVKKAERYHSAALALPVEAPDGARS